MTTSDFLAMGLLCWLISLTTAVVALHCKGRGR